VAVRALTTEGHDRKIYDHRRAGDSFDTMVERSAGRFYAHVPPGSANRCSRPGYGWLADDMLVLFASFREGYGARSLGPSKTRSSPHVPSFAHDWPPRFRGGARPLPESESDEDATREAELRIEDARCAPSSSRRRRPVHLLYSEIFQLIADPPLDGAAGGHGFVVAGPEIFIGSSRRAIPYDDAGRMRAQDDAARTAIAEFDADRQAALDFLDARRTSSAWSDRFCIGGLRLPRGARPA
jgi:hypothetical protein